MKVFVLFGTRPELIKMAPVIRELYARNIETTVCCSGQHDSLIMDIIDLLEVKVDINLRVMKAGQSLNSLFSKVLSSVSSVLHKVKPDLILVHGDTTTAAAGALSGFNSKIKVGHVEAGLRTFDQFTPFPEEMNRKLISSAASIHFAPTIDAVENLLLEKHILPEQIVQTGNTVVDSLKWTANKVNNLVFERGDRFINNSRKLCIVTIHRRENHGNKLSLILEALKELIKEHPTVNFLFSLHPNPNVKKDIITAFKKSPNVRLEKAIPYDRFVSYLKNSSIIITDSGGIQEEAPTFGVPVVLLRESTERPESVRLGLSHLVGSDREKIISAFEKLIAYKQNDKQNPYGNGTASKQIVDYIQNKLKNNE